MAERIMAMNKSKCKILKKICCIAALFPAAAVLITGTALTIKPVGDVLFSMMFGSRYGCCGEALLSVKGKKVHLPLYKAPNKPFLLIGPYAFNDYEDFFFVNKKQLVCTAVDKGGDRWFRAGKQLFILDDLNHWDPVRMPWWDLLEKSPQSTVEVRKNMRVYTFKSNAGDEKAQLAVPEKFFTSDMGKAFNVTNAD